ncbi:MAG: excalibur calcium-binding domain-containing protein [Geitlerinemataceae cyanobacterium]
MRIISSLAALAGILGVSLLAQANDLPSCVNEDCDCSDFRTWQEAQVVLDAFVGDPFLLDRDKDGTACETLPGVPAAALSTSESVSSTPAPTSPDPVPAQSSPQPTPTPNAIDRTSSNPIPALW